VSPRTKDSSQKTRLNDLSQGIKIWTDLSSVLSQCTLLTDRRTYRQSPTVRLSQNMPPTLTLTLTLTLSLTGNVCGESSCNPDANACGISDNCCHHSDLLQHASTYRMYTQTPERKPVIQPCDTQVLTGLQELYTPSRTSDKGVLYVIIFSLPFFKGGYFRHTATKAEYDRNSTRSRSSNLESRRFTAYNFVADAYHSRDRTTYDGWKTFPLGYRPWLPLRKRESLLNLIPTLTF